MKILRMAAAAALVWSATTAHGDVALVGNACDAGWDCDVPELFGDAGNSTWVWEGLLKGGEDFKFIGNPGSWNSWVPATGNVTVYGDNTYALAWYTGSNGVADNKFRMSEDTYVRITVNTSAKTVKFERAGFFITGKALVGGWDNTAGQPVFDSEWTGFLYGADDDASDVHDFKILSKRGAWMPCWNAATANEELTDGDHTIIYNSGSNGVADNKFVVSKSGRYTLRITLDNGKDVLSVKRLADPDLRGAFHARTGLMMMAYDENAQQLTFRRLPERLYIGTGSDDCQELERTAEGDFEGKRVLLFPGKYVLSGSTSDWNGEAFGPVRNVNLAGGGTDAVVPFVRDGASFEVTQEGYYSIVAKLASSSQWGGVTYASAPMVHGELLEPTGVDDIAGSDADAFTVTARDGVITVVADAPVAVYSLSGACISRSAVTRVQPGVYLVTVGSVTTKVISK